MSKIVNYQLVTCTLGLRGRLGLLLSAFSARFARVLRGGTAYEPQEKRKTVKLVEVSKAADCFDCVLVDTVKYEVVGIGSAFLPLSP
jgi:hypothetical protein